MLVSQRTMPAPLRAPRSEHPAPSAAVTECAEP